MGAFTFSDEVSSTVSADRLFKALILDGDNLMPKVLPQAIKSIDVVEGVRGESGSITKTTLIEGTETKFLKHRVEVLDKEKMKYSYTLIEGEDLNEKIESIFYEVKIEASADGGSKVTNTVTYNTKAETEITEKEIEPAKLKAMAVFKAVEDYLLKNSEAYN
ncbi:hypothetical protein ACFE04_014906 [Oxalis oulophora]